MRLDDGSLCKSFNGQSGGTEHFIVIDASPELTFDDQLCFLEERYASAREALGLAPETSVFRRFFVSDIANQAPLLERHSLHGETAENPVAVSIVQQRPLCGSKVGLLAYHLDDRGSRKLRLSPRHLLVEKSGFGHIWSTGLRSGLRQPPLSVAEQTQGAFDELVEILHSQSSTLRDHCVRTWLYLRDVDIFYKEMVDSRKQLFLENGLTEQTHYIASTGIEGACADQFDLLSMDAYSIRGLVPEQISFLNDYEHLCATKDYNVTFERAIQIAYADRSHYHISGTASINNAGEIVHQGNVVRQLDRAVDNVEALLESGSASLSDLMYLIVYLRDPSDFLVIDGRLRQRFPDLPISIVEGAVCRPGWLVEIEGMAIGASEASHLPPF